MIAYDPYAVVAEEADWLSGYDRALVPYRSHQVSGYTTPIPPTISYFDAQPAVSDYAATLPPDYESRPTSRAFDCADAMAQPRAFDDSWCASALSYRADVGRLPLMHELQNLEDLQKQRQGDDAELSAQPAFGPDASTSGLDWPLGTTSTHETFTRGAWRS